MKLSEFMERLETFCPLSFAAGWDNSGLQVGNESKEIRRVMLALDATSDVIGQSVLKQADLLLTHHPLLFHGCKQVGSGDFVGKRILKLAEAGIACYAMHTNFDVLGMADAAADELNLMNREVLSVTYEDDVSREGFGRIGQLPEYMSLGETAEIVKKAFSVAAVRVYGDPEQTIVTAAVLPGAGSGEVDQAVKAGADVMITGDISHHTGLDAVEKGIAVIDAGHYGVEKLFIPYMETYFRREMPQLEVLRADESEPYHIL